MTKAILRRLVEDAITAPSVHNVQPARWRIEDNSLLLAEDLSRRLAVGDPTGNDAAISLGAAAEALRIAASREGWHVVEERRGLPDLGAGLRAIARYRFDRGADVDPLAGWLGKRASWRGNFLVPTEADRAAVRQFAGADATIVTAPDALALLGREFDAASYGFMRDGAFRGELLGWMRLRRRHPCWARDGLNAEAMALSPVEAIGANLVLGPLFSPFDRLRVAPALLAEGAKVAAAAAVILFHRPVVEAPFESGRHFLRLWLGIERAGMGAAVLAALADDPRAASHVASTHGIAAGQRLVSAFRVGRRAGPGFARARLPIDAVLF